MRAPLVALIGAAMLLIAALAALADPGQLVQRTREAAFDQLLVWWPRPAKGDPVLVVDIGRDALLAYGPWPWPRDRLAEIVEKIADAGPKTLAIDILLAPRPDSNDERLARALKRVPTVLAAVLDPEAHPDMPALASIPFSGSVAVPDLLATPGLALPAAELVQSAQGVGIVSLPSPEGEPVRAVPMIAAGGGAVLPGLAAAALATSQGGSIFAEGPPQALHMGAVTLPLPADGLTRIHFASEIDRRSRTIAAERLMPADARMPALAGKIVFLGASAPEAGGLRLTAADPFMPSVQIQAEALSQMLQGDVPTRGAQMGPIEVAAGIGLGALGIAAVIVLSPATALVTVLAMLGLWIVAAGVLSVLFLWLIDPITPVVIAAVAVQAAGLVHFAATYRQRLAIERRFALHLPPEVVRRIAARPQDLKLAGESRIVTVLFTDIEGFTALTERAGPEAIVALLDRYIDRVAGIVVAHGGMVEKIVGDAVHAFFNAPLDLPDHAVRAVACAQAIVEGTDTLRREPDVAALQLGRTRIGIETGRAILGEVGRGAKRDYTAYGSAVNLAARLEESNKLFGSSIAIGPGAVSALAGRVPLRLLGKVKLRGIEGEIEIHEPCSPPATHGMPSV